MLNFKTILNLGISNPLILSMGHPVKARLGRLVRPAFLRGGSLMALVLVSGGLVGTSFASSETTKPNPEYQLANLTEMLISYYNTDIEIKTFSMRIDEPESIYFIFGGPGEKPLARNLERPNTGFQALSTKCYDHVREHKTPIVFVEKGKVYKYESADTRYQIWCTPGTESERDALTQADYRAGILASTDLSESEKQQAMENMQFSKEVPIL